MTYLLCEVIRQQEMRFDIFQEQTVHFFNGFKNSFDVVKL